MTRLDLEDAPRESNADIAQNKMLKVYLKTPFKVVGIDYIKQQQRKAENRSPLRILAHKDNTFDLHTQYRKKKEAKQTALEKLSQTNLLDRNSKSVPK